MRQFVRVGLLLAAILVVGGVGTATALAAEPAVLSENGAKPKIPGSAGVSRFEAASGKKIVCEKVADEGEITTGKIGTLTLDFDNCEEPTLGVKCESPGDNTGVILVKLNLEFVFTKTIGTLEAGVLLTPPTGETIATIECTVLIKYTVKRSLVCGFTPIKTYQKPFTIKCEQETGKQKPQNYTNEKGEEKSAQMLASLNGGTLENVGLLMTDSVTSNVLMELMA
jgi:hypothetical protein